MPLTNFDVIEIINLTSPCQPTLTSNFASRYWTSGHGRDNYNEDDQPLPSLESVLRDIEEVQDDLQLSKSEPCNGRRTSR